MHDDEVHFKRINAAQKQKCCVATIIYILIKLWTVLRMMYRSTYRMIYNKRLCAAAFDTLNRWIGLVVLVVLLNRTHSHFDWLCYLGNIMQQSKRQKMDKVLSLEKELVTDAKFMDNFNPKESARTQKKLREGNRNSTSSDTKYVEFDAKGRYRSTGINACDCLTPGCDGCHFPCPQCASSKCGPQCRVNRVAAYSSVRIQNQGKHDKFVYNTHIQRPLQ